MSGQRRRVSVFCGAGEARSRALVGVWRRRRVRAAAAVSLPIAALIAVLVAPTPAFAQVVGAPIGVGVAGQLPQEVAVDPVTGVVFVNDVQTNSVELISEATQSVVGSLTLGSGDLSAVAADPVSGTVYVAEGGPPPEVQVITEDPANPADDQVTATVTVPSGTEGFSGPQGIAILPGATPNSGTVYVANGGDTVSVISEATNTVTSVIQIPGENGSDSHPAGIAADPATGLVYVADQNDGYVSVISGSTLLGSFPLDASEPGDTDPTGVAADPDTGTVYVTVPAPSPTGTSAEVYVIQENPSDPPAATVAAAVPMLPFGTSGALYGVPESIAVNPNVGTVYVSNFEGSLEVINEDTADPAADVVDEQISLDPTYSDFDEVYALGVDTSTGNPWSGTVYVDSDQTYDLYPVSFPQPLIPQTISFTAPATGTAGGSASLTATGGGSGNPVVFSLDSSSGSGVCSVSGDTVSYLAAGSCVIDANQSGNASYAAAATVTQTIAVSPQLIISTATLPDGSVGAGYDETLAATGGVAPYSWSVDSGTLPPGLTLSASGEISGTPTSGGTYAFTAQVADSEAPAATATQSFTLTVDTGPVITSADSATFAVGAAGSFTVTATGSPAPELSESGALPAGLTFNSATGVLAGTPAAGTGGSYSITFTATSTAGSVTQAFTLVVDAGPVISSADSATFTAGTAGSFTVTATGYPPPSLSESGTLPAGLTFNSATGVLAGTPAAGTGGPYPVTITATSSAGSVTQAFTVLVDVPPAISSADSATFTAGTAGSFTVSTTGYPAPSLSLSGTLPAGLTFNSATGTLSGTPAAGTGGTYAITFTAANGVAPAATQSFILTVDTAPAITSADSATFTAGTAGSFAVTATGYPAPSLAESGTLPAGVSFNSATGTLSGTPAAGTGGTYPITFTAANGVTPAATQSFTLTVNGGGLAITSASSATATSGTAFSFTVTTSGAPTPTVTHTGALPAGVTFTANSNGTATLAGTVAATAHGTYPITFTAKNSTGTTSQGFLLTVDESPAFSSSATVTETVGTVFSFTVDAPAYPIASLSSGSLPGGLTFTDNGNGTGTLSGTSALAAGTYPVTVTADNTVGSTSQTITLTVKTAGRTDQVPAFTSAASASATAGTALDFTVTTAGSPTSYTTDVTRSGVLPAGITYTNNGNGTATFSGTPTAAAGGSYALTLTAKNAAGTTTQSFVLTVTAGPAITTGATATATVGLAFNFTVAATGAPTPAWTESGALPQGLTWADNGNGTVTLTGVPAAGQGGVYVLTLTATNVLGSASQTFTLTVDQTPAITSATSASATVGQAFTFTFTATGYPLPAFSHSGSVPGLTFASAGGGTATLSGTPKTAGTYTVVVTVKNAIGTVSEDFTLTVS
jgi:large repetitive protein